MISAYISFLSSSRNAPFKLPLLGVSSISHPGILKEGGWTTGALVGLFLEKVLDADDRTHSEFDACLTYLQFKPPGAALI